MAKYKKLIGSNGVLDVERGSSIPDDPRNRHWVEYQEWLLAGNVPDPADVPPPPTKEEMLAETRTSLVDSLDWVIQYLITGNVIKKADLPPELDALYEARKLINDG